MSQLLEKHKIEVPDELEEPADSSEQCHTAQFQGDITYALSAIVLSFSHVSNIDLVFDISESKISYPFFDNPPLDLLDSSPKNCDFSLDTDLSLRSSSSQAYIYYLEYFFQDDMYVMKHIIPPSIPSTIHLNNPNTIQIARSLVDSSLVSYAVIFILHGLNYFLYFIGWLSMLLVIFELILNIFYLF